jgi:hypothetical protein
MKYTRLILIVLGIRYRKLTHHICECQDDEDHVKRVRLGI